MWFGDKGLGLKWTVACVIHYCQLGVRRAKPACCRGCKSPTGKESSESILASSLAGVIARWRLKRRQRYWWAGLLSYEKTIFQDADSMSAEEGNMTTTLIASGLSVPA